MPFYWSPQSVPELCNLPRNVRGQILNKALSTMPASHWRSLAVVGYTVGGATLGVVVAIALGNVAGLLMMLVYCVLTPPVLLNLARPRMQELLGLRNGQAERRQHPWSWLRRLWAELCYWHFGDEWKHG